MGVGKGTRAVIIYCSVSGTKLTALWFSPTLWDGHYHPHFAQGNLGSARLNHLPQVYR